MDFGIDTKTQSLQKKIVREVGFVLSLLEDKINDYLIPCTIP